MALIDLTGCCLIHSLKKKNSATFFFSHGMNGSWGKKMNEFLPLKDARRWMAVEERRGGRSVNEVSSLLVMDWGLLSLLLFLSSILVCHDWAIKQLDPISNGKRQQFCSFFISSPLSRAQVSPAGGTCRSNWNPKTTPRVGIWGRQCLVHLRPTSWQMTDLLSILLLLWTRVSRDVIKHQLDPKRNKKSGQATAKFTTSRGGRSVVPSTCPTSRWTCRYRTFIICSAAKIDWNFF